MAEETQAGQKGDRFFEYDTNTLAEVYGSPVEGLTGFGIGLAGLLNGLTKGGETNILSAKVKPLEEWKPEKKDPTKEDNFYYATGGWLASKTEYEWKPITLREKKEKPAVPKKPEYPGIGEDSLINSYWIGDKVGDIAKKIGKSNLYKDRLESYNANLDKIFESLPTEEKEKLREYISRKPLNYT